MRYEATKRPDRYNVWLTDDELEGLRRAAPSHRYDLLIQLGGYVGLRAFESPQVTPGHVSRTDDGDHYRLRVPEEKDTTGSGGKPRDAYLPAEVEGTIHRYQNAEGLDRDESLIGLSESGVRAVVKRTAERAADWTGVEDFRRLQAPPRRRFAQRLLVDNHLNSREVMAVREWDSFQAIEPYFNAPSPVVVNLAFEESSLALVRIIQGRT